MPTKPKASHQVDEYLEGLFERAFDREVGQEERVFNSLSFFVAAMALTVNVFGYIAGKMPDFALKPYSLATYGMLAVAAALMVGVISALFDGVRPRVYRLPPKETDMLIYADQLRAYYLGQGKLGQALEDIVIAEARESMKIGFAESVIHNRDHNLARTAARTRGISLMVVQLALAFFIVAIIFVHDQYISQAVLGSGKHGSPSNRISADSAAASGSKADSPAAAIHCGRLQNSRCEANSGSGQMTDKTTTPAAPASQPSAQTPLTRPVAPAPQYVKRADPPGDLRKN